MMVWLIVRILLLINYWERHFTQIKSIVNYFFLMNANIRFHVIHGRCFLKYAYILK